MWHFLQLSTPSQVLINTNRDNETRPTSEGENTQKWVIEVLCGIKGQLQI